MDKNKLSLLIILLLALTTCMLTFIFLLKPLDVFIWDEAHHALYGDWILRDIKNLDWGGFWRDTGTQAWWQPLHSWVLAFFLLIFGRSFVVARSVSLFFYFLTFFLVYLISLKVSKQRGWLIAIIASALLATSPFLLVLSSLNLQESMGAFVILVSAYVYLEAFDKRELRYFLLTGLLISIMLLTKYQFGVILGGAILIASLSKLWGISRYKEPVIEENLKSTKKKKIPKQPKTKKYKEKFSDLQKRPLLFWISENISMLLGFLPLTILWFAAPPYEKKFGLLLFRLKDVQGWGRGLNFFEKLVLFLQSIVTSYTFSFWIGLLIVLTIFVAPFYFKNFKIRALSLLFLFNWIFQSSLTNIYERYISFTVPVLFIVCGYLLSDLAQKILVKKYKNIIIVLLIIFVPLVAYDLSRIVPYSRQVANFALCSIVYNQNVKDIHPPFLFGLVERPKIFLPPNLLVDKYKPFKVRPKNSFADILNFFSDSIPKASSISTIMSMHKFSPYLLYWHFKDWGGLVLTGNDYNIYPRYFWNAQYFLSLEVDENSPFYAEIYENCLKRWEELGGPLIEKGYLNLFSRMYFPDLGISAKIYKRTSAPKRR